MAFLNRVGNLLKNSVSNHVKSQFSVSNPSLLQAVRSMSSSKLFVGGLSYSTDEMSLREAFSQFGEVVEARVIMDRETGRSRGFGFVTYTSTDAATSAIQSFDGQDLHGRRIRVNYATEKPRGGGFGYGSGQGDGYGRGGYQGGGGGGNYGGYGGGGNQYPSEVGNYGGGNQYPSEGGNYGGGNQYPSEGGNYGGGNQYPPSGGGGYGGYGGGGGDSVQGGGEDNFFGGGGGGQSGATSQFNDEFAGGESVGPLEEGFGNENFEQGEEALDKEDTESKDFANTNRS